MNAQNLVDAPCPVAALEYAVRGWHVFPATIDAAGAKKGCVAGEHGNGRRWGNTTDPVLIREYWRRFPEALIGIACGPDSGLFVVECDTPEGHDVDGISSMADLMEEFGALPETIEALSPSGSWHLFFRWPEDVVIANSTSLVAPGIDVRGEGGMVIAAPSVKPGNPKRYRWKNPPGLFEVGNCPDWLLSRCLKPKPQEAKQGFRIDTGFGGFGGDKAGTAEVAELLSWIDPDSGGYRPWCDVLMALHDHFGGSGVGLALATDWSSRGAKYVPGEVKAKWLGFTPGGGITLSTIAKRAEENGADLSDIARRHKRGSRESGRGAAGASDSAKPTEGDAGLVTDTKGRAIWCAENACRTLETHSDWRGVLAFNEFSDLPVLLRPIPGTSVPKSSFNSRPMTDSDTTAAVRWFNRHGFPHASKNTTADALVAVANQTVLSPVRDYLRALHWDGRSRIANWLSTYCGAQISDFTDKVGKAWLVSAVARALRPGCKADCALVLEGRQGAGKSSILRILAGEGWFHDGLPDLQSKDASDALRGKWILELPELAAMRRSDTEAVKAFLSRTEERYRPAYGRSEVVVPRRCVFAGTTNRSDWLTDDTGGRRFWPVVVGEVSLDALRQDRDQIWAEAVRAFNGGAPWWLDGADEVRAAEIVGARTSDDPWTAEVLRKVDGLAATSTRQVLGFLDIPLERQSKAESMRTACILTRAGWRRDGKFSAGEYRGMARYVSPA